MGMTLAYGKTLMYEGDSIGLDTRVHYFDQNSKECIIDLKKLVKLYEKCKDKRLVEFVRLIKKNNLQIGVPIIDMLSVCATEFKDEAYECIKIVTIKES